MKKLLLIFSIIYSTVVNATTYYVSSTGSDSNNGTTTGTPWQTLSKVNGSIFSAGDQILFKKGDTFYGSFTIAQNGTSGNNITFGSYGTGNNPIITGFSTVSSWTSLGSNLWESTSTVSSLSYINMLTINGVNTPMGRYPKITDTNKGYYTFQSSSGYTSLTSSNLTGTPNWTGAEVVIRSQAFHLKRSIVTSQSGSTINFNSIGETMSSGNGFFFQNDDRCCTQQNEWHYISSTNKLRIYSTTTPSGVQISNVENLITVNGNYITITGITFTGANGCAIYNNILSTVYSNVTITGCTFKQCGVTGVYTNINYLTVSNSYFSDNNTSAIEFSYGNHCSATYDTIRSIGLFHGMRNLNTYTMCNGTIDCGFVTGYTVTNCKITNVAFNGISSWASTDVLIKNNYVDTFCSVLDDGGGIYFFGGGQSYHNGKVIGNTCLNGIGAVEGSSFVHHGHGIYLDQWTGNIEVSHNNVGNLAGSGIYVTSAGSNVIRWNTSYNASENGISYQYFSGTTQWGPPPIPTLDTIANNIFIAKTNGNSTFDYEKALYIYFQDTSKYRAAFWADSNYYARPYAETTVVFINAAFPNWLKTLSQWKGFSGKDTHSNGTYQTVTTVNDLQFIYNETAVSKTISLTQPMIDIKGTKYVNSVILSPYSSKVLMKDYNPAIIKTYKPVTNKKGRLVVYKGKIIIG